MSLINQMLKDLEARRSDSAATGARPLPGTRHPEHALWPWLLTGVLGLLVIALAALLWLERDRAGHSVSEVSVVQTPAPLAQTAEPPRSPAQADTASVEPEPDGNSKSKVVEALASEPADTPAIEAPPLAEDNSAAAVSTPAVDTGSTKTAIVGTEALSAEPMPAPASENSNTENAGQSGMEVRRHSPSPEEAARVQVREGLAAARQSRWALASEKLSQGLAVLPAEDEARQALYLALRRQGRLAEAEGVLADALTEAAEPARFAKIYARDLAARGALKDALAVLALAPPPVPADPEYHALIGALAQQAGEYGTALAAYEGLARHFPDNGNWLAGLAVSLDQTGDTESALKAYRQALRAGGLEPTVNEYVSSRVRQLSAEPGRN